MRTERCVFACVRACVCVFMNTYHTYMSFVFLGESYTREPAWLVLDAGVLGVLSLDIYLLAMFSFFYSELISNSARVNKQEIKLALILERNAIHMYPGVTKIGYETIYHNDQLKDLLF